MRLAVDLGLHLDPEPYVQAGVISAEEGMLRKVVWGGVFVHDRYCFHPSRRRTRRLIVRQDVESLCWQASWSRRQEYHRAVLDAE